jgi:hypothetical protein
MRMERLATAGSLFGIKVSLSGQRMSAGGRLTMLASELTLTANGGSTANALSAEQGRPDILM